jgi:hypothetical protein
VLVILVLGVYENDPARGGSLYELGPWRIWATTYRATDHALQRKVVATDHYNRMSLSDSANARERFMREARAAARVGDNHNIATSQQFELREGDRPNSLTRWN